MNIWLHISVLTLSASLLLGCGGGSGASGSPGGSTPNPASGVPAIIEVAVGDHQTGFPGETLPIPIDMKLVDALNVGVPNQVLTFSVSGSGGEVLPKSVTTNNIGHARVLVRLPDTPFNTVTITAQCCELLGTATATTGPRLVSTFGNVSTAHGWVRPDGSYIGLSRSWDLDPQMGFDFFNPDGSVAGRLGPLQGTMGAPGFYDNLQSVLVAPNGKTYLRSFANTYSAYGLNYEYIAVLDDTLSLVQFIDLAAELDPNLVSKGPMAVDNSGNIYLAEVPCSLSQPDCSNFVFKVSPSSALLGRITVGSPIVALAINSSQNLVAFVNDPVTGVEFREYSSSGDIVKVVPAPRLSETTTLTRDALGNYMVLGNSEIEVLDEDYNLLRSVPFSGPVAPSSQVLSGIDAVGNFYINMNGQAALAKYDPSGKLIGITAWNAVYDCQGCPVPAYLNQLWKPTGLGFAPLTGDLYIADQGGSMGAAMVRYTNRQFSARIDYLQNTSLQDASPSDVAVDALQELYVTDRSRKEIHVFDLSGNELRILEGPQIGSPGSIAIDSTDTKYVLDFSNNSIHVLDQSDQVVRTISIAVPSGYGPSSNWGSVRMTPGGTLAICLSLGLNQGFCKELAVDGSELFSTDYGPAGLEPHAMVVDSKGNMFVAGFKQMQVLDRTGKLLWQFQSSGIGASCGAAMQDDLAYICFMNRIFVFSAQ